MKDLNIPYDLITNLDVSESTGVLTVNFKCDSLFNIIELCGSYNVSFEQPDGLRVEGEGVVTDIIPAYGVMYAKVIVVEHKTTVSNAFRELESAKQNVVDTIALEHKLQWRKFQSKVKSVVEWFNRPIVKLHLLNVAMALGLVTLIAVIVHLYTGGSIGEDMNILLLGVIAGMLLGGSSRGK